MRAQQIKKWLLCLAFASLIAHFFAEYWLERDPYKEEIEYFIKESVTVTEQLGDINKMELYRLITVNDSINTQGLAVPGYRVYHFSVEGSKASGRIVIHTKKRQSKEEMMFEIHLIEF